VTSHDERNDFGMTGMLEITEHALIVARGGAPILFDFFANSVVAIKLTGEVS
jgi:hypothetical protein